MDELLTEQVSENFQPRPGQMDTRTFWIAYPAHVASYGHETDRISRAWGHGDTEQQAIDNARNRNRVR